MECECGKASHTTVAARVYRKVPVPGNVTKRAPWARRARARAFMNR